MQLTKKAFKSNGKEIVVTLVKMGDEEGMFIPEVAVMLGTTANNLNKLISNHGLRVRNVIHDPLKELIAQGVLPPFISKINWASRDTIEDLVKIVGTPEAYAAFKYLFSVARDPAVAAEHYKAIGQDSALIEKLVDAQTLSQEQVTKIHSLIEQALRRNSVNPMSKWKYEDRISRVTKEGKPQYSVIKSIREYFAPGFSSGFNIALIKAKDFERLCEFVRNWVPTKGQLGYFKRYGAMHQLSQEEVAELKSENARKASLVSEAAIAERKAKREKEKLS